MPAVKRQTAIPPPEASGTTEPTTKLTRQTQTFRSEIGRSAWELSDNIKILIYGRSGTGKTTLWATFPKPIKALICSGGINPGELKSIDTPEYRKSIDPRIIQSTDQVRSILDRVESSGAATLVLDHASGLQDLTLKEILGLEELPAQKSWGMATQQQYGQSSLMCKELFRAMLNLSCNVVIVAQERTFGDEVNSDIITPTVGAALTPSVTGWLNPACDYVVQTFIRPKMVYGKTKVGNSEIVTAKRGKGVEYCLRTEPHDVYMTKFRVPKGRFLPEVIVDPTYDKIVQLIRGS